MWKLSAGRKGGWSLNASKEDGAGDLATFKEAWHTQAAQVTASTNPGTTNTNPPDTKPDKVDAASKAAITNINAACNNKK